MELHDCRRILVFGGSFDPPHIGHVVLPMLAMEAIDADAVAYIPAASPPHKPDRELAPAADRLAMLQRAVADLGFAHVLSLEIDRAEQGIVPGYTVDTLEALRNELGPGPEFRLLIGGDMLRCFDTWRQPERVIEFAEPAVMVRPPDTSESLLSALPDGFEVADWRSRLVPLPQLDISATMIRERVRSGLPIRGLTFDSVEDYVFDQGLYRG